MNLIVFDIDGTIVNSVKTDDECFIQSFKVLFDIDLSGADWSNFRNVTDSGLTHEIFEIHLNRQPSERELVELKTLFYNLLNQRRNEIIEINGAINSLTFLNQHHDFSIAFATGGWRETAELKLSSIGFKLGELTLVSANEHFSRSVITKLAIEQSLVREQMSEFNSITYIGDGLWDYETTQALGIKFIGIDNQKNNKLIEAGATNVLTDLADVQQIIAWSKTENDS